MIDDVDALFLRRAVELAERGLYSVTGNPRVGCLIVKDGRVVGRGWHVRRGEAHAEAHAIADAGAEATGATAYVSLEPCCHTGRQPPCVDALVAAGIGRVVGAMTDPDARVGGEGYRRLRAAGIEVDTVELEAAQALNAGFVRRKTSGRPLVRLKLAASIDGRTAMASGESRWITSAQSRADAQRLRARSCAIVTGIGTVLADDPALNVRDSRCAVAGRLRQPLLAIADSRVRTPAAARAFEAKRPVLLFAGENAASHPRAELVRAPGPGGVNLRRLLERLAEEECNEVHVEAGATLTSAFCRDRLWDEAVLYLAPKFLGSRARPVLDSDVERLADVLRAGILAAERCGPDLRVLLRPLAAGAEAT